MNYSAINKFPGGDWDWEDQDADVESRELSLAERPLSWLIERHVELLKPLEFFELSSVRRMELESIEAEIMDRADQGELRYDNDAMFNQVREIILRGQSRRQLSMFC